MQHSRRNSSSVQKHWASNHGAPCLMFTLLLASEALVAQTNLFQFKSRVPTQGNPVAVVSGDFNQDGQQDLAVVHIDSDSVAILIGDGKGNFQLSGQYAVEGRPGSITMGDWNGDGKPDLAIAFQGRGTSLPGIAVLTGTGDGSFLTGATLLVNGGPTTVATADFNRDGKSDLVISYGSGAEPPFTVFLGNGEGSFRAVVPVTGGRLWEEVANPQSLATVDLNGDGKLDLVIGPRVERFDALLSLGKSLWYEAGPPEKIAVALGNGDGSFQAVQRFDLGEPQNEFFPGTTLGALAVGDFDGDGAVDVAILDDHSETFVNGHLVILRGNGEGGFHPPVRRSLGFNYPLTIAACDMGGKGPALLIPQLAFSFTLCISGGCFDIWPPQDSVLWMYQRRPDGSFLATWDNRFNAQLDRFGQYILCSDLNNDGKPDLVSLNANAIWIYLNTRAGQ